MKGGKKMERFRVPGDDEDSSLSLNKEEEIGLATFDAQLSIVLRQKVLYLREIAKRKRLTAPTLEELKSKSGKPFVEVKSTRMLGDDYRSAEAKEEVSFGKAKLLLERTEQAYLCYESSIFSKEDAASLVELSGIAISHFYDNSKRVVNSLYEILMIVKPYFLEPHLEKEKQEVIGKWF